MQTNLKPFLEYRAEIGTYTSVFYVVVHVIRVAVPDRDLK